MATFRESLLSQESKPKTFRDLFKDIEKPTFTTKPVFKIEADEEIKTEQPRDLVPVTTGSSISEQLKPFTTPEAIQKGKDQRAEEKRLEEARKIRLKGAEERLSNLLLESKQLEEGPEPDFKRQNELTKQILETRNLITSNQPGFKSGVREAFGFQPTARFDAQEATTERAEAQQESIQEARTRQGFGAGRVVGEIGKQAALYATVGAALKGTELGRALSTQLGSKFGKAGTFAADQLVDLFVDTVIQTPQELKRGDTIQQMGWNRLLDIGMNLGIGAVGEYFKGLKAADNAGFEKAVSALSPEEAAKVRNALETKVDIPLSPKVAAGETVKPSVFDIQPSKIDDALSTTVSKPVDKPRTFRESIAMRIEEPDAFTFETTIDALESQAKGGDSGTFRSKVVRDVPTKQKRSIQEVLDKFDTQFIDDTAPFRRLETKVTGGIQSAEESISKQARLFKGAPEAANEILRTELQPAIKLAEDAGFNYKDLGDYALAVHAKDVNDSGLKSGFSDAEIADTIAKYGTPEMEQARKELIKVSDRLLDMMREDGLISEESLTALKNKWTNYMPLFRSFDDNKVEFSRGLSDSFSNVTAPIKTLKGSDREVLDPIESMVKNIYKTVDATRRNRVGTQLAKLSDIDVNNEFIRKLDPGELVGRKNVVNVTVDGKKVPFEVEPEIFKAFNNLDKESSNFLIKVLSKPASVLRAGATLTPEFAVRNPLRDIQNAFVVSKSGFNPVTDFAAGLASTIKKDDLYQQWLREGGGYGNILSMDRQAHKQALENIVKQPVSKQFVNVMSPKGLLDLMRGVSDITESATKVGEFRAALRSGATPAEAAFRSRDLMDFARAGSSIRPANRVVAFLNANIQGKSKLVRAIKENPKGVTAKLATSMVLPSVGAYAFTQKFGNDKQKKIIKDAPDWLKNTFWLVPIPNSDVVARMPKPFDMSFAANATERFLDYTQENDPEAFDGFLKQTVKDQSIPVMLTGIMPTLEALANYSFFREGPIIPRREEFVRREDQFGPETSELAKLLAKPASALLGEESNLSSPRAMDYILRTSTGGLGSTALDGVDSFLDQLGIVDKPIKPSLGVTQLPLVKGFTVNQASSGKSVGELYDLRTQLQREKGSAKLDNQPFTQQQLLDFVNDATSQISNLTKQIKEITNSRTLSADEKRKQIDKLNELRNNIAIDTMERIGK